MKRSVVVLLALVGIALGWAPATVAVASTSAPSTSAPSTSAPSTAARSTAAASTAAGPAAKFGPTATEPTLSRIGGPMIRVPRPSEPSGGAAALTMISQNWSGYAATSTKPFTDVHAQFVQPAISCASGQPYRWTSDWVGFDGFTSSTVEQDGTFAWCGGNQSKTPMYVAWYEMYPAGSIEVFTVHPGDVIDTSVAYRSGVYTLTVDDVSTGQKSTTTAACSTCLRNSAEWIVERPLVNCSIFGCILTALANFDATTLTGDVAEVAGMSSAAPLTCFSSYAIDMIQYYANAPGFYSLDETAPFDSGIYGFTVTWERPGTPTYVTLAGRPQAEGPQPIA